MILVYYWTVVVYREVNGTPITLGLRIGDTETPHNIFIYTCIGGRQASGGVCVCV